MAYIEISNLPETLNLNDESVFPVVYQGETRKVKFNSMAKIFNYFTSISYNKTTGVYTFTRVDGTSALLSTDLQKSFKDVSLSNGIITFTAHSGETKTIDISIPDNSITLAKLAQELQTKINSIDNKVDNVVGKGLSTNDFTNELKTKLEGLENYNDTEITEQIEELQEEYDLLWNDHPDILDNNALPSGTDLTLQGTGDLKMKVDVGGNSTQVQYEGYNLLPYTENFTETKNGVTFEGNKGIYKISGNPSDSNFSSDISLLENYTIQENDYLHYGNNKLNANISVRIIFSDNTNDTTGMSTINRIFSLANYVGKTITKIGFYNSANYSGEEIIIKPMILNNVSTETDYEPYVGGTASPNPTYKQDINNVEGDVEVKGSNKNLAINNSISGLLIYASPVYANSTGERKKWWDNIINLPKDTELIMNWNFNADGTVANPSISGKRISLYYTDNTILSIYIGTSFIIPSSKIISQLVIFGNSDATYAEWNNIQFEKGSTATSYVPHAENTVTFPLSQGQKLMLGDTLEDDGIHHKRIKERINSNQLEKPGDTQNVIFVRLNNYKGINGLCTHFTNALKSMINNNENANTYLNDNEFNFRNNVLDRVYFKNSNFTSLADWTNFFNNNEVYLEYELETETIEPYTSAQQTAYNKLKEMQSYYDLTYVTGSSDNAQPIITAHAKKSIKQLSGGDLSNYQTKITSTNKLNSDLVEDTNQTNKFVTSSEKNTWNAKQNATDNNLATTNKNITSAINEVNSIARGANQALSYTSYSAMVTAINALASTALNVGQNIYIETLEVPDLWVYKVESTSSSYTYTTDSAFTTALETNGYVQVGYYKLSALETQKVDLTNYVENTDYANATTGGVVKISILTQSQYDALQTIDTNTFYMIKEEVLE